MKRFVCIIVLSLCISSIYAQDPQFSQYFFHSPDMNPAVAGSANDPRLFLHYRNQWPAFGNAYLTYQASYDQYIKAVHGGIGINILRDDIGGGSITSTTVDMLYSYRIKVNRKFTMQLGMQASLLFKTLGSLQIVNTGNTNQNETTPTKEYTQPDVGVGFLGYTSKSQVGLAVHHLNTGLAFNYDFFKVPLKFTFFYSRRFKLQGEYSKDNKKLLITPAVAAIKQGDSYQLNVGAGVEYMNVLAGVWARNNLPFQTSDIIFSVGFAFDNLTISYSYDYSYASMTYTALPKTGAHEVTILATFPLDPKRKRYSAVPCPRF